MFVPIKTDQDERIEVEINSSQAYKEPCDPPPEKEPFVRDPDANYASSMDRARLATSRKGEISKDLGIRSSLPSVNVFGKKKEPGAEGTELAEGTKGAEGTELAVMPGADTGTGSEIELGTIQPKTAADTGAIPEGQTSEEPVKQLSTWEKMKLKASNAKASTSNSFNNAKVSIPGVAAKPLPDPRANQLGGKKSKPIEINSNNLVRELKKFNKKYTQFLL